MNVSIDWFITNLRDSFSSEIMQRISDKIQPRLTFQYLSDLAFFVLYSDLTGSEEILISI